MNKLPTYWLGRAGLAIALAALLAGCGSAPIVQSQSGTTADAPATAVAGGLDQDLLRQVDAQIAAEKGRGADVTGAQQLRDSAVSLAQQQHYDEANGNLRTAAMQVGVLRPAGGANAAVAGAEPIPQVPAAHSPSGKSLLAVSFTDAGAIKGWDRVGPHIPTGTPVWDVQNGALVQLGVDGVDAADEQTGLVTGDPSWRDVTVQVDALAQDTREVGLIVRQQGESYYRFRALAVGGDSGNLILEKVVDGKVSKLAAFDGPQLSANAWHTLALSANGSTLTCSVDGQQVGSAEDGTLTAGRVGVSTLAMSGAHFANLQVSGR